MTKTGEKEHEKSSTSDKTESQKGSAEEVKSTNKQEESIEDKLKVNVIIVSHLYARL